MELKYLCPYWGQEHTPPDAFIRRVLEDGYDGIEIHIPDDPGFCDGLASELETLEESAFGFLFAAQQVLSPAKETAREYTGRMIDTLESISRFHPRFINAHTGKDHFSFDDNCRIIEAAIDFSVRKGIPVYHETHRGRFSFHLSTLLPYLKKFPELQLTADLSHFCVVSESLLEDQEDLLPALFPHIRHLHARIGFSQAPQVNDPFAPEWDPVRARFTGWWRQIIAFRQSAGDALFTITPEFGPAPYMPVLPFTRQPLADQWEVNRKIKDYLKDTF